jgi:hypothetical protein
MRQPHRRRAVGTRIPEITMSASENKSVKITLTEEQKKQLKQETGQDAGSISFSVEELEARIAPRGIQAT